MSEIGTRIRQRRKMLGMTQDKLAALTGYKSRESIKNIELGLMRFPLHKIDAFSEALHTPKSFFTTGIDINAEEEVIKEDIYFMKNYKKLSTSNKKTVNNFIKLLLAKQKHK